MNTSTATAQEKLSHAQTNQRAAERTDQTVSDIYFAAIRDGKTHTEAAEIVETIMLAEERMQS